MTVKKRFIPQLADVTPAEDDFSKMLETVDTSHVKEGSVVKGQVVEIYFFEIHRIRDIIEVCNRQTVIWQRPSFWQFILKSFFTANH